MPVKTYYDIVYVSLCEEISVDDLIENKFNPFVLATEDILIGISSNIAIYTFPKWMIESQIERCKNFIKHYYEINLKETRFCKTRFSNSKIYYTFGNIMGVNPIFIPESSLTEEYKNLIAVKLKNVKIFIDNDKYLLDSYEFRN